MDRVRDKCRNQFETQNTNYMKFEDISESRAFNHSEKAYTKFNVTNAKSRELQERTILTVDDHRHRNVERFSTRDVGLKQVADAR